MDVKNELQKAIDTGLPIAVIAKRIGRDPSTLNKWLHNTRGVSKETQQLVKEELQRIKNLWNDIL